MTMLPNPGPVRAGLLAALLPPPVSVADTFEDCCRGTLRTGAAPCLFPEEEALLARAVPKRRREFTTVRHCARTALAGLGVPPVAILPGTRGAPRWPDGVVGSLTHCAGYRAAAVATTDRVAALGVDAEPAEPLGSPEVLALVTDAAERQALAGLAELRPEVPWDRLLFSAKEAVYKAWYPLTERWLGFHDVRVVLDPDGAFDAALLHGPSRSLAGAPLTGFAGRWLLRDGLVVTAVMVPAD